MLWNSPSKSRRLIAVPGIALNPNVWLFSWTGFSWMSLIISGLAECKETRSALWLVLEESVCNLCISVTASCQLPCSTCRLATHTSVQGVGISGMPALQKKTLPFQWHILILDDVTTVPSPPNKPHLEHRSRCRLTEFEMYNCNRALILLAEVTFVRRTPFPIRGKSLES